MSACDLFIRVTGESYCCTVTATYNYITLLRVYDIYDPAPSHHSMLKTVDSAEEDLLSSADQSPHHIRAKEYCSL